MYSAWFILALSTCDNSVWDLVQSKTAVVCRLDGWNSLTELGNHDPTIDVDGTSVDVDGLAINVHGHAIDVDGPAVFSIKSSSPSISSGTKGSDSDAVFSNVDAGLLYFQKL